MVQSKVVNLKVRKLTIHANPSIMLISLPLMWIKIGLTSETSFFSSSISFSFFPFFFFAPFSDVAAGSYLSHPVQMKIGDTIKELPYTEPGNYFYFILVTYLNLFTTQFQLTNPCSSVFSTSDQLFQGSNATSPHERSLLFYVKILKTIIIGYSVLLRFHSILKTVLY